jgi:hypothetical protein
MTLELQRVLDLARSSGKRPDLSEGMAELFEDTPASNPVMICTVSFAKAVCSHDRFYVWRKI